MKILIGDDGPTVEVEDLDGFRVLARRLGEPAGEDEEYGEDSVDLGGVLKQSGAAKS